MLGDGDVDIDAPATIAGTLDSCRLEELEDRCSISEDDIDSDKSLLVSLILWYLLSAALVRRVEASEALGSLGDLKLLRSFFWSSILRKSEMLSSSVLTEPELVPPSAKTPDPG